MNEVTKIVLYTLAAGLCIPIGGALASVERIRPNWLENEFRHFVVAFGGGVLLAAIALVLVPEGNHYLGGSAWAVAIVLMGGLTFFGAEVWLGKTNKQKPQLLAMMLDYIPECMALGGAFALGASSAPLLALFIGVQNLPEGFNAFRELQADDTEKPAAYWLGLMLVFVPLGPMMGLIGWAYFVENVVLLGSVMLFASGGILYLIFQDIAPQAHMQKHWAPPLGAVLGFCLGMLGHNLL